VTTRGRTLAALLAVLGRPSWWILGLAGFLVRGGIVIFAISIVTLPSPLALSNVLGPLITPLYLGRVEPSTLALVASGLGLLVACIACGSWIGAATEVVLIRDARQAAIEEGLPTGPDRPSGRLLISRSALAHLLALVPLMPVLAAGSVQIFAVAYRELVNPTDASSIVVRVVLGAAAPLAAVAVVWILCELVGGMAVRRIVLADEPVVGAVIRSAADLARRPIGAVIAPLLAIAILVIELAAVLAAVVLVWTEVRTRLIRPLDEPLATVLSLATLGAAWCLALLVTGLIDAWRSVAMTFEAERVAAVSASRQGGDGGLESGSSGGTFGASAHRRPGDWFAGDRGGSL
jgi:hypothetical protein